MTSRNALLYVEIDTDRCQLVYGNAPCTAALGAATEDGDSSRKCFNTRPNCQDPANYDPAAFTQRFARPTDYLPRDIDCIPNVKSMTGAPAKLDPGKSIGQRESVTIEFFDHPYHDINIDKYALERRTGAAAFAGSMEFAGSGEYVDIGDVTILDGQEAWTVMCWMKVDDPSGQSPAVAKWNGTADRNFMIDYSGGDVRTLVGTGPSGNSILSSTQPVDTWVHVALVKTADDHIMYINGGSRQDTPNTHTIQDMDESLLIGAKSDTGSITAEMDGSVAQVSIWTRALSQSDIAYYKDRVLTGKEAGLVGYWLNGSPEAVDVADSSVRDYATNSNNGTINGSPTHVNDAPDSLIPKYNPSEQGTFWGKWRARNRYYVGRALRVKTGELGQSLNEMATRHYIIESVEGPNDDGTFRITAKDALKLSDEDRAQAPKASPGFLPSAIAAGDSVSTLNVSGGAVSDYPSSGYVRINDEVFSYTGVSDTGPGVDLTGVSRAQLNTVAEDHDSEDNVQHVLAYESQKASDILYDLFTNYTNIDPSRLPLSKWNAEDDEYIGRLYTGYIGEPTGVRKLADELAREVGFMVWDDPTIPEVRIRAIRTPGNTASDLTDDDIIGAAPTPREQPKKRRTQVWVFFGRRRPTEPLDEPKNFRSIAVSADADAASSDEYGRDQVEKIYSRWIGQFNKPAALDVGARILNRFVEPPRAYEFMIPYFDPPLAAGDLFNLTTRNIQKETGEPDKRRSVVLSFERNDGAIMIEAEEFNYDAEDATGTRLVVIDTDTFDFNLRDAYDGIYASVDSSEVVECHIEAGVLVGES